MENMAIIVFLYKMKINMLLSLIPVNSWVDHYEPGGLIEFSVCFQPRGLSDETLSECWRI